MVLPAELTGVKAPIVVLLGRRFPMIGAHKVLAAYACLLPRLVTGQFDPSNDRAVWPSTGNYCRGGVAISRILGCRGVAVLPAGMSRERFDWLQKWVADSGRYHSYARHRKQRKRNLRQMRENFRETSKILFSINSPNSQIISSIITARDTHSTSYSRSLRAGSRDIPSGGLCFCDGIGGHDRRRRPAQETARHQDRRRRGRSNARPCSATAMASTISRASATSIFR